MKEIVEAWLEDVQNALGSEPITVSDVRVGVFYTTARLSSTVGVAFTPRDQFVRDGRPRTIGLMRRFQRSFPQETVYPCQCIPWSQ